MPTASISHSLFDIQIHMRTSEHPSVLKIVIVLVSLLPKLIATLVKNLQEKWLRDDLGPPGTVGNLFSSQSLACPKCGSQHVNRKDYKVRKPVVPVFGEIKIPQRRVECRECGAVYKPYEKTLGLPKNGNYTKEVLIEGIKNVMVMSYEKASCFTTGSPSAGTLHRAVGDLSPTKNDEEVKYELVVLDATDVPKWKESGQITLTLAHEVKRGPEVYGRSTLKRKIVALAVGKEKDIKKFLEEKSIQGLLHDGKL